MLCRIALWTQQRRGKSWSGVIKTLLVKNTWQRGFQNFLSRFSRQDMRTYKKSHRFHRVINKRNKCAFCVFREMRSTKTVNSGKRLIRPSIDKASSAQSAGSFYQEDLHWSDLRNCVKWPFIVEPLAEFSIKSWKVMLLRQDIFNKNC